MAHQGPAYTRTVINVAAGATIDLGGNAAGKYAYLEALVVTLDAAGTITIKDDSDGVGGGTPVAQSGDIALGANGGINWQAGLGANRPRSSVLNRHMTIVTDQGCNGFAVVAADD